MRPKASGIVRPGRNPVVFPFLQVQLGVKGQHGGAESRSAVAFPECETGRCRSSQPGKHAADGLFFPEASTRRKACFRGSAGHWCQCVGGWGGQRAACTGAGPDPGLQSGFSAGVLWNGRRSPLAHTLRGSVLQVKSNWDQTFPSGESVFQPELTAEWCTSTSNLLIYKCNFFVKYIC